MISARTPGCVTNDARQAPRFASSLRAGMITDTSGRTRRGRVAAGFAALRGARGFLPPVLSAVIRGLLLYEGETFFPVGRRHVAGGAGFELRSRLASGADRRGCSRLHRH